MAANPASPPLEAIHPALWRGTQLAQAAQRCIATGYPSLTAELPGGGWPTGSLIELLPSRPGIGEIRLLRPALAQLEAPHRIALVAPPYSPHIACCAGWTDQLSQWLWIAARTPADTLWATEQILKNGAAGAVLCWVTEVRSESLRRLHLAAQTSKTLFFLLRPGHAEQGASPAPLRLALAPAKDGLQLRIVKRRGPSRTDPLYLALNPPAPLSLPFPYAPLDRRVSTPSTDRRPAPALAT